MENKINDIINEYNNSINKVLLEEKLVFTQVLTEQNMYIDNLFSKIIKENKLELY